MAGELVRHPNRNADTPSPNKRLGWAFPTVNFAGRGYRFNLGARPQSDWDFSSKIHDLMYLINEVMFSLKPPEDLAERSRRAKADFIFREMNRQIRLRPKEQFLNKLARLVFLGEDRSDFRDTDHFCNIIGLEELTPDQGYFMIPWSAIPKSEQRDIENRARGQAEDIFKTKTLAAIQRDHRVSTRKRRTQRAGKKSVESNQTRKRRICDHICDEIKFNTRSSVDDIPWRDWAETTYESAWGVVLDIS